GVADAGQLGDLLGHGAVTGGAGAARGGHEPGIGGDGRIHDHVPGGVGGEEVEPRRAVEGVAGAVDGVDVAAQLLGHGRQTGPVAGDDVVDAREHPARRAADPGRVVVVGPGDPDGLGRVGADVDL